MHIHAQTHLLSSSDNLRIPTPTEPASEPLQATRLVLLDIGQFLTARVPERAVLGVFGRAVDGQRRRRAVQVRRAVGQRDHLRESVGPLGAAQQRGVPDLRAEPAGWAGGWAERAEQHAGRCCGWHFFVGVVGFFGDVMCFRDRGFALSPMPAVWSCSFCGKRKRMRRGLR